MRTESIERAAAVASGSAEEQITVCVTGWNRPYMLRKAIESALAHFPRERVVCSCVGGDDCKSVLDELGIRHTLIPLKQDPGCNLSWLAGLMLVRTPRVIVLHDDDILLPYPAFDAKLISNSAVLTVWEGNGMDAVREIVTPYFRTSLPGCREGTMPGSVAQPFFLVRSEAAVSPVVQCWTTRIAVGALREAERYLRQIPACNNRKGMLLGNELLTSLRHCRAGRVQYMKRCMSAYGSHPGSESIRERQKVLLAGYNAARAHFEKTPSPAVPPQWLHVLYDPMGDPGDPDNRRALYARAMWEAIYGEFPGRMRRVEISEQDARLAAAYGGHLFDTDVGGNRGLPSIQAILAVLLDDPLGVHVQDQDIIVLTNGDVSPTPWCARALLEQMQLGTATHSFRVDTTRRLEVGKPRPSRMECKGMADYAGSDLFVFTVGWLRKWMPRYPELLYSYNGWDWVMRRLIMLSGAEGRIRHDRKLVYHEKHEAVCGDSSSLVLPGQRYNRGLARHWLLEQGVYWGDARWCQPMEDVADWPNEQDVARTKFDLSKYRKEIAA